jgi:hypothetical protein
MLPSPNGGSTTCPTDGGICHGCGGKGWVEVSDAIINDAIINSDAFDVDKLIG